MYRGFASNANSFNRFVTYALTILPLSYKLLRQTSYKQFMFTHMNSHPTKRTNHRLAQSSHSLIRFDRPAYTAAPSCDAAENKYCVSASPKRLLSAPFDGSFQKNYLLCTFVNEIKSFCAFYDLTNKK